LGLIAVSISLATIYLLPSSEVFSIVRLIAGGITVLLVPGYALVGLLFPRKSISLLEHIGLGLITSVVAVPILWLSLDWLSVWGEISSVIYVSFAGILMMFASTYRQFLTLKKRRSAA
jgi:uncharacterized membrane protein